VVLKLTWKRILAAAGAAFVLGMAIAWSGVVNIGASTGHWAITDWFLHWTMRNTVRTYAAFTVGPAEDSLPAGSEGLVSAAGHYASQCAVCHGAPGEQPSPVIQAAVPPPPDLAKTAGSWSGRQLFWIVKHGIKFTAMPAWPAQDRDDEVRQMAAFVAKLPGMSPDEYRKLAYGDRGHVLAGRIVRVEDALPDCNRCHAADGRGQPDIPALAGQKPAYLAAALHAFASGERSSAVMTAAASRLDASVIPALAEHYAGLPPEGKWENEATAKAHTAPPSKRPEDRPAERSTAQATAQATEVAAGVSFEPAADLALAAQVVEHGLPELNLPACSSCHAPNKRPNYPLLDGQKAHYMAARLRNWRGDPTVVDARKPSDQMPMIARRIPEHLIEPLARHFSSRQPPQR
jgi:cytochrome c553